MKTVFVCFYEDSEADYYMCNSLPHLIFLTEQEAEGWRINQIAGGHCSWNEVPKYVEIEIG
jgi:hypothetical protein